MTTEQVKASRKARQATKKQKRRKVMRHHPTEVPLDMRLPRSSKIKTVQHHSADSLSQTIDNLTAKITRMIGARDAKRDLDEVAKYSSILRNLTATVYVAKIATELENISDVLDAQLLMSKDIIKAIRKTGG
jgi:hypothetical protein